MSAASPGTGEAAEGGRDTARGLVFGWLERLGYAAWFGAGAWFGLAGAPALFGTLGGSGSAGALAALFPSLFTFGVVSGLCALVGAVGGRARAGGLRRVALALVVTACAAVLALAIDPWVHGAPPGSADFALGHLVSAVVSFVSWVAAAVGLLA